MSNAFNSLKNKAQEISRNGKANENIIFLKDDQTHLLRLLPNKNYDPADFATQFNFAQVHYSSGKVVPRTMFSPLTFDDVDPIKEFVDKELSVHVSTDEYKIFKNMEPSFVAIAPAVVRGEEKDGAKLFVFSTAQFNTLVEKIEKHFQGEEIRAIWDVEEGFDIIIEVKSSKKTGKPNRTVEIDLKRTSSPLKTKDMADEVYQDLLENHPNWEDAYPKGSEKQLRSYLASYLEAGDADENENEDYEGENSLSSDVADYSKDEEDDLLNKALADFEKVAASPKEASVAVEESDDDMPF